MLRYRGVTVRPITVDDIEAVYNLIREDPDRNLYIGGEFNLSREEFIKFLLSTEYGTFVLQSLIEVEGKLVGIAVINNISMFRLSAHFRILVLKKEYRKRGYGFYAGAIIGSFLFYELKLHKIYAGTWSHNTNMDEIYKSAGFKHEGIDRDNAKINSKWVDRKLWGLLRGEVPNKVEKIISRIANENKIT